MLQDVPGPKLQIGPVAGGLVDFERRRSRLVLTAEEVRGRRADRLRVTLPGLSEVMQPA